MDPTSPNYERLQTGAGRPPAFDIDPWRQASTDMTAGAAPPGYNFIPGVDGPLSSASWEKKPNRSDSSASSGSNPYPSENSGSPTSHSHSLSNSHSDPRLSVSANANASPNMSFYPSAVAGASGLSSYNQPERPEIRHYHSNNALEADRKSSSGDIGYRNLASPNRYAPPSQPPPGFKAKSTPNLFTQVELKGDLPPTPPPELSLTVSEQESDQPLEVSTPTQHFPSTDWSDVSSTAAPHPLSLDEFAQTMLPSSPTLTEPANQDSPSFPQPWGYSAPPDLPPRSSVFLTGPEFASGSGNADIQGRYSFYPDQRLPVPTSDYKLVVSTKNMDIYLDRGNQNTKPDYGKGEAVVGYIDLKKLKNVIDMSVTLEGRIQVMFTKGGKMYEQIVMPLFTMTRILYSSASNRPPSQSQKYLFELKFPTTCDSRFSPLPPSWWISENVFDRPISQPAFFAKVEYRIRADMAAKNLMGKKQYRVETPAGYHPRNCPPFPLPSPSQLATSEDRFITREIRAALPPMGRTGFEELLSPTPFFAKVQVQQPLVYISGSSIPYAVHLSSPVHTVPAALKLQVQLIKTIELWIYGKGYLKEYVVGKGDNSDARFIPNNSDSNTKSGSKGSGGATVIFEGSCQVGEEGREMTWKINRLAYVKYSIRFTVTPTAQAAEFATFKESLPAFCHSEDIEVVTDPADAIQSEWDASRPSNRVKRSNYKSKTKSGSNSKRTTMDIAADIEPFLQPDIATTPTINEWPEERPSKI